MKRIFFLVLFLLLVCSQIVIAQSGLEGAIDEVENKSEQIKEFTEEDRWEYIGEGWKEVFLRNELIAQFDSFFRGINVLFIILFGESYDISLGFFILFIIWIAYFMFTFNMIKAFSAFQGATALAISLGLTIILAQMRIIIFTTDLALRFLFFREGIWKWISPIMLLFALFFFIALSRYIRIMKKRSKEQQAKTKEKNDRKILDKYAKAITKTN